MRISDWSSDVCSSDLVEVVDGDVFVVPEQPGLPVEAAPLLGFEAELLADLPVVGHAVGRFRSERNQAGAGIGQEHRAVATVDVAAVERLDGIVAGDLMQVPPAQVPSQARASAPGLHVGTV